MNRPDVTSHTGAIHLSALSGENYRTTSKVKHNLKVPEEVITNDSIQSSEHNEWEMFFSYIISLYT